MKSVHKPWDQWGIWGIRLLFALYLVLGTLGFLRPLAAIGQPFGGFIWQRSDPRGFTVSWEVGRQWPARQAGLALEALIVRIQGQEIPLSGEPDVVGEVYSQAEIGQLVDYQVEQQGKTVHIQVPVTPFTWRYLLESYIPFFAVGLAAWTLGLLVHLVNPRERASQIFTLFCLALSATFTVHNFTGFVHRFYYAHWSISLLYGSAWSMINALSVHFFSVVPETRPWWPRIRPWVYGTAIVVGLASSLANALWSANVWQAAPWIIPTLAATAVSSVVAAFYDIAVTIVAYRRSPSVRARQQIRVIGLGLILGLLFPFLSASTYIFLRAYHGVWWAPAALLGVQPLSDWLVPLPLSLLVTATVLPAFVAVALLRYEAFGAKPALVKAAGLTLAVGTMILVYALAVTTLQLFIESLGVDDLLWRLSGEKWEPQWLSGALAALVAALLYSPLRDRIHRWITHLLYPYRISSDEALQQLIEAVQQVDQTSTSGTDEIPQLLIGALKEMLHVESAFLWFYSPTTRELQAVGWREPQATRLLLESQVVEDLIHAPMPLDLAENPVLRPLAVALAGLEVHIFLPLVLSKRELVGLVGLGPRRDQVPYSDEDRRILSHLAEYLLLLLRTVRTIHSLEQVRERVVEVQERERQGIARELHDGPLQHLAYLATVKLELCKQAVAEPVHAAHLIEEAQADVGVAMSQLRGMLSDISPDVISHRGLVSALGSLVAQSRGPGAPVAEITLQVDGYVDRMLPESHELALFRFVQEALRNALQHAHAKRVDIRLARTADRLLISLQDNGRGFDMEQQSEFLRQGHLGLQSMRDRISSIHGRMTLESAPGLGTAVWAEIPFPQANSVSD